MVQLSLAPVINEKLFSKHFLKERIKGLSEWQEDERAKVAYEKIKEIYEEKKEVIVTYTDNESQLEMDFIRPVLKALGHIFGVQATVQQSAKRPDYAFFEREEDKTEAFKNKDSDDFYKTAIAVGDAKAWNKDLDKKMGGKDIFENHNPSFQIFFYLRETHTDWGILTNGRKWRLYFEEVSHGLDTYYEVDLVNILEKDDFESFKYFYLFFRREAFINVGDSFLDRIYNQSVRFAEEIGENLESNVYKALLWMAKGYFDMKTNQLEKNEENVRKVHEDSLIFFYRLLFLLYAESKGMLGTEVPRKYANQYSFTKWVDDILDDIDNGKVNPKGGLYNFKLGAIFRLVREGSEALGISKEEFYFPAYNGGLFDNEKHPFLRDKKIQDGHLARVVDLLVRAPSKEHEGRGKIDYSDLSLRHLGGIYEGLLEYKLKLADQNMVAIKKNGTLKWIPASEAEKDFPEFDEDKRAELGELYLATDRGERKATGSYYTPDYIVRYIVENTVGPAVEEKLKDAETEEKKIDAILSMKVLDPAMGSGHFLVETVDFLASKLAEITKGEEKERDIDWAKRKVARNCIYGVDLNPLATELAKVSLWLNTMAEDRPLSFLDHHLKTGNSLIGANIHKLDKHPEGVEKVPARERKIGQLALSDFFGKSVHDDIKQLLGVYREMLEVTEERPEDIKEQEELFQKFGAHPFKKRFDVLSDVHTSYYFGNEFSKSQYERLLEAFRSGPNSDEWNEILQEEWVRKASDSLPKELKREDNLSDQKQFFHWKLEFPEVFFDMKKGGEKENPGFDVVVGNPPYIRIETLDHTLADVYDMLFYAVHERCDIYVAFVELSYQKINTNGRVGLIVSNQFMVSEYGLHLRKLLSQKYGLVEIIDFTNYSAFPNISTYSCILIGSKHPSDKIRCIKLYSQDAVDHVSKRGLFQPITHPDIKEFLLESKSLSSEEWVIEDKTKKRILDRVKSNSLSLGDIALIGSPLTTGKDNILYGKIKKEYNNEIVLTFTNGEKKNLEKQIWKKILRPKMIKKWVPKATSIRVFFPYVNKENKSFELIDADYFLTNFPKTYEYLIKYKNELLARKDSRKTWLELNRPWYSLHRVGVPDNYLKPKILVPSVIFEPKFCHDKNGLLFPHGGIFGITPHDYNAFFLLGLLNSSLTYFFLSSIAPPKRGGYISLDVGIISKIPIRIINFKTSQKDKNKVLSLLKKHYLNFNFHDIEIRINSFLPKDDEGNLIVKKEKSDVVHDFLAFLAEQMIEMNEQKLEEINGFLSWFEGEIGGPIDNLSSKATIKEYHENTFDKLIEVLKKNKKKLSIDPHRREFQEKLKKEFDESIAKLTPLKGKIQETDKLIDQIVYKLYGLTDEEIKIVEESFQ